MVKYSVNLSLALDRKYVNNQTDFRSELDQTYTLAVREGTIKLVCKKQQQAYVLYNVQQTGLVFVLFCFRSINRLHSSNAESLQTRLHWKKNNVFFYFHVKQTNNYCYCYSFYPLHSHDLTTLKSWLVLMVTCRAWCLPIVTTEGRLRCLPT